MKAELIIIGVPTTLLEEYKEKLKDTMPYKDMITKIGGDTYIVTEIASNGLVHRVFNKKVFDIHHNISIRVGLFDRIRILFGRTIRVHSTIRVNRQVEVVHSKAPAYVDHFITPKQKGYAEVNQQTGDPTGSTGEGEQSKRNHQ